MAEKTESSEVIGMRAMLREAGVLNSPYLSTEFKVWVMGFIFFMTFLQLFALFLFPSANFLSEKFILSVVLILIGYLWVQEIRDRDRVKRINAELVEAQIKLQKAEIDTISSLIRIVEAKDPMVRGHSERVARLAVEIGRMMDFSQDTLASIYRAGILHDLGKLAIKDEILRKPQKLSPEEWEIVKRHPQLAVDILEPLKFLHLEKKIILYHHERVDGKGYPSGLKDTDIPLESRIIGAVETFDEMNSPTVYRERLPREVVLEELQKVSGTQLDSSVVALLLSALEKHPEFWQSAPAGTVTV
ncbi:MAG: HD-GYP domain-containing protein [Candidatus Omnitrophota bacterium]|nr:HD-GYP domain-containing protein [Candidatus Omnitrophota bacterium]MDZ4243427.1 HD-GYP domain-containing protein [Candidatus Omnitrophota bacterium]